MTNPRAIKLSLAGAYKLRIELEDDVFGELDLEDALSWDGYESLRSSATFCTARIDAHGVITWANGAALAPSILKLKLKLQQFVIGTEFTMSDQRWRCTDTGTRTLCAIKLDHDDDPSWYNGPSYAVAEHVIDEDDLPACELAPEELQLARERLIQGRLARWRCHAGNDRSLLRPRAEIRERIWMVGSVQVKRIGRGNQRLERSTLEDLAKANPAVAALLENGVRSFSKRWVHEALHVLFDARQDE